MSSTASVRAKKFITKNYYSHLQVSAMVVRNSCSKNSMPLSEPALVLYIPYNAPNAHLGLKWPVNFTRFLSMPSTTSGSRISSLPQWYKSTAIFTGCKVTSSVLLTNSTILLFSQRNCIFEKVLPWRYHHF